MLIIAESLYHDIIVIVSHISYCEVPYDSHPIHIYIYIYIYIQGQTLPLGKGRRGRRAGYVVLMGRVSVPNSYSYFIFIF